MDWEVYYSGRVKASKVALSTHEGNFLNVDNKILETKGVEVELSGFEFRGFLAGPDVEGFWNLPFHRLIIYS